MFNPTIDIGTIINTIGVVGSVAFFVWRMQARLDVVDVRLATIVEKNDKFEKELNKLTDVVVEQAKQTQRLDTFDDRLKEVELAHRTATRRVKR